MNFNRKSALVTVVIGLTAGCAAPGPENHGDAVRQMIAAQTHTPNIPAGIRERGAPLDGVKAWRTLDSYRKDIGKPSDVKRGTRVSVEDGGVR